VDAALIGVSLLFLAGSGRDDPEGGRLLLTNAKLILKSLFIGTLCASLGLATPTHTQLTSVRNVRTSQFSAEALGLPVAAVRRIFPGPDTKSIGALALVFLVVVLGAAPSPVHAQDQTTNQSVAPAPSNPFALTTDRMFFAPNSIMRAIGARYYTVPRTIDGIVKKELSKMGVPLDSLPGMIIISDAHKDLADLPRLQADGLAGRFFLGLSVADQQKFISTFNALPEPIREPFVTVTTLELGDDDYSSDNGPQNLNPRETPAGERLRKRNIAVAFWEKFLGQLVVNQMDKISEEDWAKPLQAMAKDSTIQALLAHFTPVEQIVEAIRKHPIKMNNLKSSPIRTPRGEISPRMTPVVPAPGPAIHQALFSAA